MTQRDIFCEYMIFNYKIVILYCMNMSLHYIDMKEETVIF